MKKIIVFIFLLILLTGCQKNNKNQENSFDDNPNVRDDISMYNDEKDLPDCFSLCYNKIQEICLDEIVEIESDGMVSENSIFNEEACEKACLSKWNDYVLECMGKVTKCDSITQNEPYCKDEKDDSIIEIDPKKEINYGCSSACYKYKVCAMMADDATTEDGNEAYNTCFEECQNWSETTLTCIKDAETGTGMGCAKMSACAMGEYNKMLK